MLLMTLPVHLQAKWGNQSPYGAELVPLLRSVAGMGSFDAEDYSKVTADRLMQTWTVHNTALP